MQDLLSITSNMNIDEEAFEYFQIASKAHPTEKELDRLGEILEQAIYNETLDFWINEIDHILGHRLELINQDNCHSYRDQQSILQEHYGENLPSRLNSMRSTSKHV